MPVYREAAYRVFAGNLEVTPKGIREKMLYLLTGVL